MTRAWLGSLAGVLWMLSACGSDVDEADIDTEESSGSDSGSNTSPTSDPTMTTMTTMTSLTDASADGSESTDVDTGTPDTGSNDTGSSGGSSDGTETTDADTSGTDSTGDGSSSGGPVGDDYPTCMGDDECSDPYTLCWPPMDFGAPNFCTLECEDAKDCPVPTGGDAVPVCEGPPDTNVCVLDCTEGDCPEGMACIDVFGDGNFMRCLWA